MAWLVRILTLAFLVAMLLLALAFMTANEEGIALNLFVLELPLTSGVAITGSFIIGTLLALIATYPVIVSYKYQLKQAQKKQLDALKLQAE